MGNGQVTPEALLAGDAQPLTPPPAAAAVPAPAAPSQPDHAGVGKMFHAVLDTLSGGQTEPAISDSGEITDQPAKRSGGDWARRLLAGALTGMAAGSAAPSKPGAPALSGLGAGFMGETEALQQDELRKRAQLQQSFQNQQAQKKQQTEADTAQSESTLRAAQTAYLTTQNASLGLQLTREKAAATQAGVDTFNAFEKAVAANPENQDLGVFADMNAVLTYRQAHPELVQQIAGHASGQIVASPNLVQAEDGNWTYQGVRAALVRPDVAEQTVGQVFGEQPIPGIPYFVPGKMSKDGGQEPGTWQMAQPAPGTRYGDYLTALQKGSTDAAKENSALAAAQVRAESARAEAEGARASLERAQTQQLMDQGLDEMGKPLPAMKQTERDKRYDTFTKDYVKDKNQLEQAFTQMSSILDRARKGQMTGADSVVGLFNAVGISSAPLKGRGFRVNSQVLAEHIGARNVYQTMQTRLSKLTVNGSGEVVTPKQLEDYTAILGQARHDLYVNMAQEAERQGLPKDFLPRGNNAPIDVPTAKIFLDVYGNDPATALSAARKFGWVVPQAPAAVQ